MRAGCCGMLRDARPQGDVAGMRLGLVPVSLLVWSAANLVCCARGRGHQPPAWSLFRPGRAADADAAADAVVSGLSAPSAVCGAEPARTADEEATVAAIGGKECTRYFPVSVLA